MALPLPTHQFTIPSLYDNILLQCRIYHPDHLQPRDREFAWIQKGAIIAHPYAPLGGCYDDPVVATVASELLRAGYVVGTFNLRGAGGSQGRTSWTARPELGDFISFYAFLVFYILGLKPLSKPTCVPAAESNSSVDKTNPPSIIVSGYSYGSMLASYLPTLRSIQLVFAESRENDTPARIMQKAWSLSSKWNKECWVQNGIISEPEFPDPCTRIARMEKINISYLLITPILPPISFFTATSLFTPTSKLTTTVNGKYLQSSDLRDKVLEHETLAIFGNKDGFTSSKKLISWCEELKKEGSRFNSVMVRGAGHFWHEDGSKSQMKKAIREWVAKNHVYYSGMQELSQC
ncbi:hypothetical protein MferCBS31731_006639 [Microsporum ferrugineum]